MIISNSITVGQLTFILRVAVQLLSYAGPALIGILILSNIPRLAPIDTHDVVNRIVGASTATLSTGKWIINHIRRNPAEPTPPTNLLLILILSITYTIFVSLSDIGFLGFYACSIPGHDSLEFPASLTSEDAARSFISTNMINGTDLATVTAWRCDSSSPFPNSSLSNCTSWHNSTYDDPTLFAGINSTDSDVLVSRQLRHYTLQEDESYNINAFYLGPDTQPLTSPTIINGLAINPHPTGVQVITGVPQLSVEQNVTIPQTLAIEVEVGCMTLGLQSVQQIGDLSGFDFLVVDDTWQKYSGPDYLYDTLYQAANATRQYLQPFFDQSTLSNGIIRSFNSSSAPLSAAAKVTQFYLPYQNVIDLGKADSSLLANCTANLQTQLGLTPPPDVTNTTSDPLQMCGYLGIGGSMATQGSVGLVFQSMICAAATQVNMVSSTITVSATNITNITSSRSQSNLNYVRADFFDNNATLIGGLSGINANLIFLPYERYTLTPSSKGATSHFISPSTLSLTDSQVGPGSGGTVISKINSIFFDTSHTLYTSSDYAGLRNLPSGFTPLTKFSPSIVTQWMGQVAGSAARASLAYNGWAALQVSPILVTSTGGSFGTCYNPFYGFGFLPLAFATLVVLIWALIALAGRSLLGSKRVEKAYGGLAPYAGAVTAQNLSKDTLLIWEQSTHPWLQVVDQGYPITGHPTDTTLKFLKTHSNPK